MTTIGYGDVVANSYREKIFCIFVAIVSSVFFCFSLNNIGIILTELG